MQTIKTGVVVALLLAVCYGAFVALNAPDPDLPATIDEWASGVDEFDFEMGDDMMSLDSAVPVSADDLLNTTAPSATSDGQFANGSLGSNANIPDLPSIDFGAVADPMPETFPELSMQPTTGQENSQTVPQATEGDLTSGLSGFPAMGGTPPNATQLGSTAIGGNIPLPGAGTSSETPSLGVHPVGTRTSVTGGDQATTSMVPPLLGSDITGADALAGMRPGSAYSASVQGTSLPTLDFATARNQALTLASQGDLKDALSLLSPYYNSPELGYAESEDLVDILDALSREVIYSKRHVLEPAYVVTQTDSVASVASRYQLNPEFLSKVNGLGEAKALVPGSELKVVRGPFRASVDLTRGELTLFLGDHYAGRFPISVGSDPTPRPGAFSVVDRQTDRTYYGSGAKVLPATDPRNPYGGYWLNLGDALCIHGTAEMASSDLENAGCISLAPLDASDVYDILVVESQVEIKR